MKYIIALFTITCICIFGSCTNLVDDINDNPNGIALEEIAPVRYLTGIELAHSSAQVGHLNRISGLYSGQLTGLSSLYSNIYGYNLSSAESIGTWSRIYVGVTTNARYMRERAPNDLLLQGIAKTMEASAIGLGASLFGNVPYSQINNPDIEDPEFDNQIEVFNAIITLLGDAISDFDGATSRGVPEDIYFNGDADKWKESAYTLQARYYTILRNYESAYTAAQKGISSSDGNLQHIPRGEASITTGDKNLFWEILEGSRTGDIGSADSYLAQILDPTSSLYRGNAKTDETARSQYSYILETGGSVNLGIIEQFEPQNIVSFEENQLSLAEAGARARGFDVGLQHLNEYREWLNMGGRLNANFIDLPYSYEPYAAADFAPGGMENLDNLDPMDALLREIIEERYISGFGQFMPFDDARRLRKGETNLLVPFPLNTTAASQHPERMPYSNDELNSNSNAPMEPGIFVKTPVNE